MDFIFKGRRNIRVRRSREKVQRKKAWDSEQRNVIVGAFIDRGLKRIAVVAQGGRESHDLRKRVERLSREESCVLVRSWTLR